MAGRAGLFPAALLVRGGASVLVRERGEGARGYAGTRTRRLLLPIVTALGLAVLARAWRKQPPWRKHERRVSKEISAEVRRRKSPHDDTVGLGGKTIPGPKGYPLLGSVPDIQRDNIQTFMDAWRTFGDIVHFSGHRHFHGGHFFHGDHFHGRNHFLGHHFHGTKQFHGSKRPEGVQKIQRINKFGDTRQPQGVQQFQRINKFGGTSQQQGVQQFQRIHKSGGARQPLGVQQFQRINKFDGAMGIERSQQFRGGSHFKGGNRPPGPT